jgi:hypothetical protein
VIATNVIALTVQKMFTTLPITLTRIPTCVNAVENLNPQDFEYYDKDGFELNRAERKFYDAMKYPIDYPMLNHKCWQEPWLYLNDPTGLLIMDHSMFLCRASYEDAAAEQLTEAWTIDPRSLVDVKRGIREAILAPTEEAQKRMRKLRQVVFQSDAKLWAESFLERMRNSP